MAWAKIKKFFAREGRDEFPATWGNIKLIFSRELRDQLRDRRTLFTIAVLPILLYPLLGMTMLQVAQFSREHPTRVYVIGEQNLPEDSNLIADEGFAKKFCPPDESRLLQIMPGEIPGVVLKRVDQATTARSSDEFKRARRLLQHELAERGVDALLFIPDSFAESMNVEPGAENKVITSTSAVGQEAGVRQETDSPAANLQIFVNSANDKSRIAADRLQLIFDRYHDSIVDRKLAAKNVTLAERKPFEIKKRDLASDVRRRAAVWSRILPFVVLVWALTGAFYPAIDLCAGEKERGTLETLLCSPARRSEIVIGKLLTIMTFSMATSLLNLASMAVTGLFVINQMSQLAPGGGGMSIGPPPIYSLGWLIVFLVPIAMLFSALSLAVASFARSSKEGQYYLMPLMMVVLPLLMLPMLPAAELNLGSSLIPITGVVLLLRSLIEGRYAEVAQFVLPVIGVTLACCALAIRWAINQFNNESVLFRESERFGMGVWIRSLVRDRKNLPTFGQAIMCGLLILVIRFFGSLAAAMPETFMGLTRITLITLIGLVLAPALIMAITLTRKPLAALSIRKPGLLTIPAAMLLAMCLHPAVMMLSELIMRIYPMGDDLAAFSTQFSAILEGAPNILCVVALIALTPAICEELVFRGFILNGLLSSSGKWTSIFISSLFFGAAHAILQQSLSAFVLGLFIGYIAVQTRSIFPCMAYHFVHNSMAVLLGLIAQWCQQVPALNYIFKVTRPEEGAVQFAYQLPATIVMSLLAIAILLWFQRLPSRRTSGESSGVSMKANSPSAVVV